MEQYGAFQFCCPSSLSSLEWQKVWPIWWLLGWQWLLLWSISHPVQHAHCSLQLLQKPVVKQMSSSWLPCLMFPQRYIIIFVHYFCSFWIFIFFNSIFMTINFIKDTLSENRKKPHKLKVKTNLLSLEFVKLHYTEHVNFIYLYYFIAKNVSASILP